MQGFPNLLSSLTSPRIDDNSHYKNTQIVSVNYHISASTVMLHNGRSEGVGRLIKVQNFINRAGSRPGIVAHVLRRLTTRYFLPIVLNCNYNNFVISYGVENRGEFMKNSPPSEGYFGHFLKIES
jgi:hypothetical protein